MRGSARWVALAVVVVLLVAPGSLASAPHGGKAPPPPRVALVILSPGCQEEFLRVVCDGFRRATRATGVKGRVISPGVREDPLTTLQTLASQNSDLVLVLGFVFYEPLARAALSRPDARFALLDASIRVVPGQPKNVQGVVFRASEAGYLAGWLAGRLERLRPEPDVVGAVGGVKLQPVQDFVVGFRAGVRRAAPRAKVLVSYSNDFLDPGKCAAIARRQIARGAGAVFNVAGFCGLGALQAAKKAGVWGIGVDSDQSFLGSHMLTSVTKDFEAAIRSVLRRLKAGKLQTGGDTILTLREGAVGLGKVSSKVPRSLRKELTRLERRVTRGDIRVPGAYPDPR